jgi:hypothetical protein
VNSENTNAPGHDGSGAFVFAQLWLRYRAVSVTLLGSGDKHLRVLAYDAPQDPRVMEAFEHRIDFSLGVILGLEVLHKFGTAHFHLASEGLQHL